MEERQARTIRFPTELVADAQAVREEQESFNDLVITAVERELARRRGLQAFEEILRIRDQVEARTGLHPDSTPLIRAMRDGEERYE
ncbi:MAG: YlcI/YnfO family protein [Dehalococcoidia bacterium]